MFFVKFRAVLALWSLLVATFAWGDAGITYHGRLLKPDGEPVTRPAVQFLIQIRTPSPWSCLMYQEVQVKDLSQTSGVFSITINDGSQTQHNTEPFSLDEVFRNHGRNQTFPSGKCSGGTVVPFVSTLGRQISVSFNDGTFSGWEPLPSQEINFVPSALEAISVGGRTAENFFRVEVGSVPESISPWSLTNYQKLLDLMANTTISGGNASIGGNASGFTGSLSGDVTGGQASTKVEKIQGNAVLAGIPSDKQVLTWNHAQSRWEPANVPVAGNPDWDDIVNAPTSLPPSGNAGGDLAGSTYPNPVIANNAITAAKINDGAVAFSKIAAGSATGQVLQYEVGVGWKADKLLYTDLVKSGGGSPWPTNPCVAGEAIIWQSATDGFECAPISITELDPTVKDFAKADPSSDFDISGGNLVLKTVPITRGGTGAVSQSDAINNLLPTQGPHAGKILQTDGTNVSWATAPSTGITALTGDVTASGTGSVATAIANSAITNVKLAANAVDSGKIQDGTISGLDLNFTGVNSATSSFVLKDSTGKFANFVCATTGHVPTWGASGFSCQAPSFTETDPKVGANTTNMLSKWDGSALVASGVYENGGNVGIGTATPQSALHVNGSIQLGDDSSSCPGAGGVKLGSIRYNSDKVQVCRSGGWTQMGGSTASSFAGVSSGLSLGVGTIAITGFMEEFDVGSDFNASTGVFTAPSAGQYLFTGMAHAVTAGVWMSYLSINGSSGTYYGSRFSPSGPNPISTVSYVVNLNAGDVVQLVINSTASSSNVVARFAGSKLDGGTISGASGDNLGNGIATSNVTLGDYWLTNDGTAKGIRIDSLGNVGIGTASPGQKLSVAGVIESTSGGIKFPDGTILTTAAGSGGGSGDGSALTNLNASELSSGTVPAGRMPALTGDVTATAGTTATTLSQIQGKSLTISTPTAGDYLKYNGTGWVNDALSSADLSDASGLIKASQMPANCAAGETLTFSSPTGAWVCSAIAGLDAGVIATGTIDAARLPASATYWTSAVGGINYAGGNVGVGTAAPSEKLEVAGKIKISGTGNGLEFPDGTTLTTAVGSGGGGGGWVNDETAFVVGQSLTADTWKVLDLSSKVGNNKTLVLLKFSGTSGSNLAPRARTNGETLVPGLLLGTSFGGGTSACQAASGGFCYLSLQTDANGKIEYQTLYASVVTVTLMGYVTPSSALMPNLWSLNGSDAYFSTGNVGIGTGTPSEKLEVAGKLKASSFLSGNGTAAAPSISFAGDPDSGFFSEGFDQVTFSAGGTRRFSMDTEALFSSTTDGFMVRTGSGTAAAPTYSFRGTANNDIGMYATGFDNLAFSTTGQERLRIDSAGNVGVGTPSPKAKLDVAGEVKFGNTSSTCNSTNEGQQRYNSTLKVMEFCNGTTWAAIGGGSQAVPQGTMCGHRQAYCNGAVPYYDEGPSSNVFCQGSSLTAVCSPWYGTVDGVSGCPAGYTGVRTYMGTNTYMKYIISCAKN